MQPKETEKQKDSHLSDRNALQQQKEREQKNEYLILELFRLEVRKTERGKEKKEAEEKEPSCDRVHAHL